MIEDVISKHQSIQHAAVLISNFHEALKMYIPERLTRFMYPSLITHLPALPTSTSGKINRRALM